MAITDDEARVRELLAPLATIEPVIRRTKQRRPLILVVAVASTALIATGIALAAGLDPFAGIRAADHPRDANDTLSPAALAAITSANVARGQFQNGAAGQLLPDSARLVTQLSAGDRVYAVATTTGGLCVLIQEPQGASFQTAMSCGNPLSQNQPTTEETIRPDPATPPLSFGVARDGVVGISFIANGSEQTVLVKDNVWAYRGAAEIPPLTIHYADGSTEQLLKNH
ncbi:MAG TPA: hypothetical protein VII83_02370 [Gaiellaceae bacterium]|jgi:hypothetical protein